MRPQGSKGLCAADRSSRMDRQNPLLAGSRTFGPQLVMASFPLADRSATVPALSRHVWSKEDPKDTQDRIEAFGLIV